jgi:hypothetical protein
MEQLQSAQQRELQGLKDAFGAGNSSATNDADEDGMMYKLSRDKYDLQARLESTQATLDDTKIVNAVLTQRINAFGLKHALLPQSVQEQLNETDLFGPQENLEKITELYQKNTQVRLADLGKEFSNRHFSMTNKAIQTAVDANIASSCVAEQKYVPTAITLCY